MLAGFFVKLKDAKLPVSVKEYLVLLEAIKEGVKDKDGKTVMKATEGVSDDEIKAAQVFIREIQVAVFQYVDFDPLQ